MLNISKYQSRISYLT